MTGPGFFINLFLTGVSIFAKTLRENNSILPRVFPHGERKVDNAKMLMINLNL